MAVRSTSKSYIKLIAASKKLFWKYGIKRVTVEEICKEAGVSKMTFYRCFKNKEAIAKAVIDKVFNTSLQQYEGIMREDVDFRIKVNRLLELKQKDIKGISVEFINDINKMDSGNLKSMLDNYKQLMRSKIIQDFKAAQDNGDIRQDLNLDFVVFMLNDLNDKLLDKNLNKMYPSKEVLIMELTNFFFYGILP